MAAKEGSGVLKRTWNTLYSTFIYQAPTLRDLGPEEEPDMVPLCQGACGLVGRDHKPRVHHNGPEKPSWVRGPGRDVCGYAVHSDMVRFSLLGTGASIYEISLKKGPMTQATGMKHPIIQLTRVHFPP